MLYVSGQSVLKLTVHKKNTSHEKNKDKKEKKPKERKSAVNNGLCRAGKRKVEGGKGEGIGHRKVAGQVK